MPKPRAERIRNVTAEEMAQILEDVVCKYGLKPIRYGVGCKYLSKVNAMKSSEYHSLATEFLIAETPVTLELTTIYHVNEDQKKFLPTTWICSLNNNKVKTINGLAAFTQFQRVAKIPSLDQIGVDIIPFNKTTGKYAYSAIPYIGSKTAEIRQYSNVYEYDINSAYSSVLLNGVPNFAEIDYNRVVRKGEIGFYLNECLSLAHEGEEAAIICPLVPPSKELKNFIYKWYNEKQNDVPNAKGMLNFPIGYHQRKNPLFRAYVVNTCNEKIKALIDSDVVMWNTDAVYSLKPLDLEIGDKIGQWKEIKIPLLKTMGCNYQIGNELPVYRGIPKYWFENFAKINGRPFDITKDTLPERVNKWFMDWEKLKLLKI